MTPLPGIAVLHDRGFLILGKVGEDKVLIQHPMSPRPEALSREQFETKLHKKKSLLVTLHCSHLGEMCWALPSLV